MMPYEPVIGLEVHAELCTQSKMFCGCAVLSALQAVPNSAVCPVCAGMPGVLPVVNRQAVELGLRAALALGCAIPPSSLFARKNYFYPDLPKGYQISQYEQPLAVNGQLTFRAAGGEKVVRIRRVHLEEDTGKLTHVTRQGQSFSLVDLNRAGVPLLEIVSEPDLGTLEEVRAYTAELRSLLRALGVSSGDMEKGALRFEANISLRRAGSAELGTRVEIKNLNSFRLMERALAYEIERQGRVLAGGGQVSQETVGWDEVNGVTYSQRSKEEAHDYRYFPEPDLPPLVVDEDWLANIKAGLPELPRARALRYQRELGLNPASAWQMAEETPTARYFEAVLQAGEAISPQVAANWISGELFGWVRQSGAGLDALRTGPQALAELLGMLGRGQITAATAKTVLDEMLSSGRLAGEITAGGGLQPISDGGQVAALVRDVLAGHPREVQSYLAGKHTLANWFFGQVMQAAGGRADPKVVRQELERQLAALSG